MSCIMMPLTCLRMNARFILNFLIEYNLSRTQSLLHVYERKQSNRSRNVSAVFTAVELQLGANLALLPRSSVGAGYLSPLCICLCSGRATCPLVWETLAIPEMHVPHQTLENIQRCLLSAP